MSFSYNGNRIEPLGATDPSSADSSFSSEGEDYNFFFIQGKQPLTRTQKANLQQLHDINSLRDLPFISRVSPLEPDHKISPALKPNNEFAAAEPQKIDVVLHDHATQSARQLSDMINKITEIRTSKMDIRHGNSIVRLQVTNEQLFKIAKIDDVASIDKVRDLTLFNDVARKVLNSNFNLNNTSFQGKGQIITVADTGFDAGSVINVHPAFRGRVRALVPLGRSRKTDDADGHGTHVCGSALSDGVCNAMGGVIQGTAPKANLVVQALDGDPFIGQDGEVKRSLFGISTKSLGDLLANAYDEHNSRIHTSSWGPIWDSETKEQAPYRNECQEIDGFVWENQDLVVCFAAGNDGQEETAVTGAGQVGGQPSAKNVITVGSCDNQRPSEDTACTIYDENGPHQGNPNHVSDFSSRGPTADGRIKPDVVAPGTMILSPRSRQASQNTDHGLCNDGDWMFSTGTSMATPLVAGCAAALREHLITQGNKAPSAALVKALLINGAIHLRNHTVEEQGFGRVDLSNSIFDPAAVDKGFFESIIYNRDDRDKATLVYMDKPGSHLQNNINLVIHCRGAKRHGNRGNAQDEYDTINNVEQVVWKNLVIGIAVTVEVSYRVAMLADAVPFAVAWSVNATLPEQQ
ncbi:hypothetical protein NM208_g2411 [Fusarium decemcellulare]|uniref:Uncharacterized protein n=1 Tax=Fusarium decemcellulare TaxID=57161 RepID=A0ACC1SSW6_9HYPO|nr:hypothetical protein NM208_g2411 [Fusarium decemcellulare]